MKQDLKRFEHKDSFIVLRAHENGYLIKSSQYMRIDLRWVTESIRSSLDEAVSVFEKHKQDFMRHRHCVGDVSRVR